MKQLPMMVAFFILVATAQAASFNCAKAGTIVEQLICADTTLSTLDEELNAAYKTALQDEMQVHSFRQAQKFWLKERNNCKDTSCIKQSYEERLLSLNHGTSISEISIVGKQPCQKITDLNVPYDFYVGVAKNSGTFAQPIGPKFGLLQTAIPIVDIESTIEAARLCDGGIVTIWRPETYGKFPELLMARIYDDKFSPRTQEFRVTETDEAQWEHSVGTLYDGNYVVTWKTFANSKKAKSNDIKIRARIFDSQGHSLTKSFDVSTSPGSNYRARVYGLRNGGFFVLWALSSNGTRLRVFNSRGTPKSQEIFVTQSSQPAYGYESEGGGINVFLENNSSYVAVGKYHIVPPFTQALSIDEDGVPLTNLLEGESVSVLEGYQQTVEHIARSMAIGLENQLRKYKEKDVMGFVFCDHQSRSLLMAANKIKAWTKNLALRNFAIEFCEQTRNNCTQNKLNEDELEQCLKFDPDEPIGITSITIPTLKKAPLTTITTLAGSLGVAGYNDGLGVSARFANPIGITSDDTNLFVSETVNNTIRKIEISTGKVTTLAGKSHKQGYLDGVGTEVLFNTPYGLTTDGTNLYVVDVSNHVIRKIVIATGEVTTLAGNPKMAGYADGIGSVAQFSYPYDVVTDGANLYVTDHYANTIRKIVIATAEVTTIAGTPNASGYTDGKGSVARFSMPTGITTDGINLYVVDSRNYTVRQIVIATGEVTTIAGPDNAACVAGWHGKCPSGYLDGIGNAARFSGPSGITTDGTNLYITESKVVRKIVIATGEVTAIAGYRSSSGNADGKGAAARIDGAEGITASGHNLYFVNRSNHTVRKIEIN